MTDLEVAKLYTVSEPLDRPVSELIAGETAVEIQFNPTSLKVSLSNSLKENERSGSSRAAQFIDKSSSNLSVELIFDTSDKYLTRDQEGGGGEEVQKDVRTLTGPIANTFMQSDAVGDDTVAPQRCLFTWGSFAFVGVMESFDETLEFFSPKGTPLRATVAIKLSESRFQFRTEEARAAERDTPTLGSGGASATDATTAAGKDGKDWRDTAMYNGVESPRASSSGPLSIPSAGASASLKASAGIGGGLGGGIKGGFGAGIGAAAGLSLGGGLSAGISGGLSAGVGVSGGISAGIGGGIGGGVSAGISGGLSAGVSADLGGLTASAKLTSPAFSFGASASLGTGIPGAFSADFKNAGGLTAGSIVSGGVKLGGSVQTAASLDVSASAGASASANATAAVGFD
ncbi:MAG: hypothetical protein PVG22_01540 [Chromatiales bacterium]|jgi:hypothetical protein